MSATQNQSHNQGQNQSKVPNPNHKKINKKVLQQSLFERSQTQKQLQPHCYSITLSPSKLVPKPIVSAEMHTQSFQTISIIVETQIQSSQLNLMWLPYWKSVATNLVSPFVKVQWTPSVVGAAHESVRDAERLDTLREKEIEFLRFLLMF